ncbi:unnamed protein product [Effrenium voratum]|nr:unnamed protein product [Effrenium voratum]
MGFTVSEKRPPAPRPSLVRACLMTRSWEGADGVSLAQSGKPHGSEPICRIAIAKRHVLTGGQDGSVAVSDLRHLEQPTAVVLKDEADGSAAPEAVGHRDAVQGLAWLPQDNRLFASGGAEGLLKVWDASELSSVLSLDLHSAIKGLAMSGTAQVAAALEDLTLRLVDLRSGRAVNTLQGHTKPPLCAVWGEKHLFSGGMDGTLRAWDCRMGARSLFLCDPYAHEGERPLKRSAPKEQLAQELEHKVARIEPYRFRSMRSVLGTHRRFEEGSVQHMAGGGSLLDLEPADTGKSEPDGVRRAREQFTKEAELRSRHVFGPPRREYAYEAQMAHRGAITSVCASQGRLISCGVDGKVRCWHQESGHLLQPEVSKKQEDSIKREAGSWRSEVNVECGTEERPLQMAALSQEGVCLIPEEELVAVYCLQEAKCLCRLAAHKAQVLCCEAASSTQVLSAGSDGLLLSWNASPGA